MSFTKERKEEIFTKYGKGKTDTGSPEAQIALMTHRIQHLTEHLRINKKDFSSRLGLLKLVGKRRKMLSYLQQEDIERYRGIIKTLDLRK
jgi:small subunit ribosomal protein S15